MPLFKKPEDLVDEAKTRGENLARAGLKTHQLRRIYETIQSVYYRAERSHSPRLLPADRGRLLLLKPQLAYVSREKKETLEPFSKRIQDLIDGVGDDPDNLREFYDFVQSVLAYHKYYQEGKEA